MVTRAALNHLLRNPAAYAKFVSTGKLPTPPTANMPLERLLKALGPYWLGQIRGLKVGPPLGFNGMRRFETGHQALAWLEPSPGSFNAPASHSWRIANFHKTLTLEDLEAQCTRFPRQLYRVYPRLSSGKPTRADDEVVDFD